MPFFSSEHHRLHYGAVGNPKKPAALILHGFLGSHQDFETVLPAMSEHFYCIMPDLPGHGRTLTDPDGYTFSAIARTLLNLLDHLQIERAHLLGYSMGGRLALYTVCTFPERFAQIILESASPGLKTASERAERKARDRAIAHQLETIALPDFLARWYQNALFNSLKKHPTLYQAMLARRQQNNPIELANALQGFSTGGQPSLWKQLPKIDQPMLFIVGAQDRKFIAIGQEMLEACQQNVATRAEIEIVLGCGHNVHLENPERYVQAVRAALQRFC